MAKARTQKAPGFIAARASLYLVGAASAAFGVAGWLLPADWSGDPWQAIGLAVMTALSALVVPTTIEIVGRAFWSFLILPAAIVFGLVNAYSFHNAVDALIEAPRRAVYQAEIVAPKAQALAAAQAAVVSHTAPIFPDTMGPKNIAARMEAWSKVHQPLIDAEARAKADLDAVPAYVAVAPNETVWTIAGLIDLSLALALAGISLVRVRINAKIKAEKAAKAKAAQKRQAKAPKAPRAKPVVSAAEQAALIRSLPRAFKVVQPS